MEEKPKTTTEAIDEALALLATAKKKNEEILTSLDRMIKRNDEMIKTNNHMLETNEQMLKNNEAMLRNLEG